MRKSGSAVSARVRAATLALTVLSGCTGGGMESGLPAVDPPSEGAMGLASAFGTARVEREVGTIDLGTAEARAHLGEGWSYDEESGLGRNGVWATGSRAVVRFFVERPRDLDLELGCWALPISSLGPQETTVLVNQQPVGSVTIGSNTGGHYRISVPSGLLRSGDNTLAFDFAWSVRPADAMPDSEDRRSLSVMFDEIVFDGLLDAEEPAILDTGEVEYLRLPPRSSVSFFEQVPQGASLWIGAVLLGRGAGRDSCALDIGIETESGHQINEVIHPGTEDARPLLLEIGSQDREIVGIRFTARSATRGGRCRDALQIIEPHIIGPPAEGVESETGYGGPAPPWVEAGFRPNVIVYLVDCLRADHLGTYGYTRNTTPNIDRFARNSVVFTRAMSASSWTRPSVASLLTGMSPQAHATRGDRDGLSESVPLVQEILRDRGYETAAVITNGVVSAKFGFGRGFDAFRYLPEQHTTNPEIHQLSDKANTEIFEWLGQLDGSKPFFLYVHTTDPHAPYLPRAPYRQVFAAKVDPKIGLHPAVEALTQGKTSTGPETRQELIDLYDGEIAFNDGQFGRLVSFLESEGLYDGTLIVLTADHGEEFGDHGRWQHGFTLYQEQLHVPLVMKQPAGHLAGQRRTELVSLIDVAPTLLEAAGVDVPGAMMGRSLRPWRGLNAAPPAERPVFADLARDPKWRLVNAVISGDTKLIRNHSYDLPRPKLELFDIGADAAERHNLAIERWAVAGFLETLLRQASAVESQEAPTAELSAEEEEKLRALGYLE